MNRIALFAAALGVTVAMPLDAQGRGQTQRDTQPAARTGTSTRAETRGGIAARLPARTGVDARARAEAERRGPSAVPRGHWPSAGMCRVWLDGVAPGQQPKEMDCATARRRVPANGRVLEGPARNDRDGRMRDRNDRGRDDNRKDRDRDDDRYDRDDDDDDDDDKGRVTRRFIDRNGLECEERAVTRDGRRSYDLKCREPKRGGRAGDSKPARGQQGDRYCVDADRDGRCDSGIGRGYPASLPEMMGAVLYGSGQRTSDVTQWLGTGRHQVRYTDADRDRRPERVRWLDAAGAVIQEWVDSNGDGRADVVNVYSAGRIVQSIGGR